MGDFHLNKYPVISENGNEYLVSIFPDQYATSCVNCVVYVKKKGIFNRGKFVKVFGGDVFDRLLYNEQEWDYAYVDIANHGVRKYEKSIFDEIDHKRRRREAIEAFEAWDGNGGDSD